MSSKYQERIDSILTTWAARIERELAGKRGVTAARARLELARMRVQASRVPSRCLFEGDSRRATERRIGLGLARLAGALFDEHGYTRGDYLTTFVCDAVPASKTAAAPYYDLGHGGLALVEISRKRVYAKSCTWRPSETSTRYLVGRNESGSYFAHAVARSCRTVRDALDWIWSGHSADVVRRQGDVAVIRARGPRMCALPAGHCVEGDTLVHATHPAIAMPGRGERLIVGRRAAARVSNETRD